MDKCRRSRLARRRLPASELDDRANIGNGSGWRCDMVSANQTVCPQGFHLVRKSDKLGERILARLPSHRTANSKRYWSRFRPPSHLQPWERLPETRGSWGKSTPLSGLPGNLRIFVTAPRRTV